jgi:hypothetical protein
MANTSPDVSFILYSWFKGHKTGTEKSANETQCFKAVTNPKFDHTERYLTSVMA